MRISRLYASYSKDLRVVQMDEEICGFILWGKSLIDESKDSRSSLTRQMRAPHSVGSLDFCGVI
jgi:hypothetical protein